MRRGHYYNDDTLPTPPPNLGLVVGGVWHTVLEEYHRGTEPWPHTLDLIRWMRDRSVELMVEAADTEQGIAYDEDQDMFTGIDWLNIMAGSFAMDAPVRWDGKPVIGVEVEVRADLGSPFHQLHGYLDLVVDDTFGPVGVDHKTAAKPWRKPKALGDPRHLIQAPLYAEGWFRMTGQEMNWFAYDVMTYGGLFDRVWVDVCAEIRAPFVERWVEMSALIHLYQREGLTPPVNPSSFLCSSKYCPWWEHCPAGAGLEVSMRGTKQSDDMRGT
jgi:hypothetical protein